MDILTYATTVMTAKNILSDGQETLDDLQQSTTDAQAAITTVQNVLDSIPQDYTSLSNTVDTIALSNNGDVNLFFKELLLVGVDYDDIKKISVNLSTGYATFNFKDTDGTNIVSFAVATSMGDVFSAVPVDNKYMFAYVDWDNITPLATDTLTVDFSEKINDISYCPKIRDYITNAQESAIVPIYTRTSSKRIDTSGHIVDAGSSWFYTSPIQVKCGDFVYLRTTGNSSVAPICLTDSTGSFYTPSVTYTGIDPSLYFLPISKDGYVAISGYAGNDFRLALYRNTYIQGIVNPLNTDISNLGSRVTVVEEKLASDNSLKLNAIDYGIKIPTPVAKIDVESLTNWGTNNGAILSLSEKYDNIARIKRKCVTVLSNSGDGWAYCNLASPVNANNYALMVSICLGEYNDTVNAPAGNIAIELFSGSSRTATYKATLMIQGTTGTPEYNTTYNRNGWFNFCMVMPSVLTSKYANLGESFDFSSITALGVHLYNTNNIPVTLHVAEMSFVPLMQKKGIVTIIDNFGVSVPAMADYAYSKGVRLNLSIIPGFYAGASGAPTCASKAELDRIAQQGHCIWNHTWTHATWNTLTAGQIQDQINYAETWMKQNGFGDDRKFISVPSAKCPTYACNSALDSNAQMIFHVWTGANKENVFVPYHPALRCIPTTLLDADVSATKTGAEIGAIAGKGMTYGGVTVMGFHGTYWEIDDGDSWKEYIDTIAAIDGVYHYGLDEIYNGQWY